MSIAVLERTGEFAVLKAVGWRGRHITGLVLTESLILSVVGSLLGLTLGYGASVAVGRYLRLGVPASGELLLFASALLAVLVGTVGGLYPAVRANRFAPAEIFRHG